MTKKGLAYANNAKVVLGNDLKIERLEQNIMQLMEGMGGPILRTLFMRGVPEGGEFHAHIEIDGQGLCIKATRKGYRLARATVLQETDDAC